MAALQELVRLAMHLGALLLVAAFVLRLTVVDVVTVTDNGMAPTLVAGDQVLVWRAADVDLADVVVCPHPAAPERQVLSRAIGFGKTRIRTDHHGQVYIGDARLSVEGQGQRVFLDELRKKHFTMRQGEVSYAGHHSHRAFWDSHRTFTLRTHDVGPGRVYLLGDNRAETSYDSRAFGEVDPDTCTGQVFMRLRPAPDRGDDVVGGYLDIIR